jgi:biotin-dependent carboxylase-like uncharacterized protein
VIVVRRAGLFTTVQDLGRAGLAHLGVPRAGAVDVDALRRANRLVGNPPGAAALETTADGPELVFEVDATVAVHDRALFVPAGRVLDVGPVRAGLRGYVAVRGGLDVPPVLGSRSTCTLSGLGPPPVRDGDRLGIRASGPGLPGPVEVPVLPAEPVLRVVPGPREKALTAAGLDALLARPWTVTPASDRTALRLDGPPLERAGTAELASEGVVPGALQVPPDGRPVLLLAAPTTGGYPVVAVVRRADLWLAAQAAPGTVLRFAT